MSKRNVRRPESLGSSSGGANPEQQPSAGEPRLVITSTPLDLELCSLLGEKPSDFVILLADGKSVPGFGTPYDSEAQRARMTDLCRRLNADGKESWYIEFLKNWGRELSTICTMETRPVFSWELHRVCAGHSSYVHCAIRLLDEDLKGRVTWWCVGSALGKGKAELVMNDRYYIEEDPDLALAIGRAVARALRDAGGGGAELEANYETGESNSGAGSPTAEVSDECPPLTQPAEKPRTGTRSLH